jgi:hypothetical protein
MSQSLSIQENYQTKLYYRSKDVSLPVSCNEFWMIEHKDVNYYIVDLKKADINTLKDIVNGCAAVEAECWNAQEDFYDYIKKCDLLSYAVINDRIIGFDAATLFFHGTICMFCNDETMISKAFRHRNIARNLVFSSMRWFLKNMSFKNVKHFAFMSISGNPRIVNGYYKHRYIKLLFDCSFNASDELIEFMDAYRERYKLSLVHKDYSFSLKNVFPGSNIFDPTDKRFQFLDWVKKSMPEDFDNMKRGDAFAFLVKASKIYGRILVFIIMTISFGKKFFSRKGIGIFARNNYK